MVKIRLRRVGAKKKPAYRIIVADSRNARDGRFIETLGTYNPLADPAEIKVDIAKAKEWIGKGAQPTDTVRALLKKAEAQAAATQAAEAPETETPAAEAQAEEA